MKKKHKKKIQNLKWDLEEAEEELKAAIKDKNISVEQCAKWRIDRDRLYCELQDTHRQHKVELQELKKQIQTLQQENLPALA